MAAGFLPEVWTPDAETEQLSRLVARRNQVVKHRTRIKNEVHAIVHAHLIPRCPHADLFNRRGREWLARQPLPSDETAAIERHVRELDRLGEDLVVLDREVAQAILGNPTVERMITITGVNVTLAAGLVAAIGDVRRFASPQKLVSYLGLNPRVRQSGLGLAQHGRISKAGRSHARAMLVEGPGQPPRRPVRCAPSSYASAPAVAIRLPPLRSPASLLSWVGICSLSRATTSGRARPWWPTRSEASNCKRGNRPRRETGADRPMRTTSRPSEPKR